VIFSSRTKAGGPGKVMFAFPHGIKRYQDELPEGAFCMQRPVDSVACNKDSLLFVRSSWSCGVSLSSGVAELICGGTLQLI